MAWETAPVNTGEAFTCILTQSPLLTLLMGFLDEQLRAQSIICFCVILQGMAHSKAQQGLVKAITQRAKIDVSSLRFI